MADLGGGVYVSRVDSDEYEPDDEVGGFRSEEHTSELQSP